MTKEFGANLPTYATRFSDETARLDAMRLKATPPLEMRAAPIAPARGVMQLVQNFDLQPGGTRRHAGAHWVEPSALEIANSRERGKAGLAAVEDAQSRAARRDGHLLTEDEREAALRKVDLFTPAQVATATRYRDLVEWRTGSAIKCARLEGGSCGGGSGEFIDAYITYGNELAAMVAAIGTDVALSPRRHMDRDNARAVLTVRAAVDGVVLRGWTISRVIAKAGWAAKGTTRLTVRNAIRGALDRMQGYR